jgi:hypothetical protein
MQFNQLLPTFATDHLLRANFLVVADSDTLHLPSTRFDHIAEFTQLIDMQASMAAATCFGNA